MTLEQVIRYAITGVLHQGYPAETVNDDIQDFLNILIDFGNITDEELTDLLRK